MDEALCRELTYHEKRKIRKLVVQFCANYDKEYGCLPLDYGRCYMLEKCWATAFCRYFENALLPLDAELLCSLQKPLEQKELKKCVLCGRKFLPNTSQVCCSEICRKIWRRKQNKKYQMASRKRRRERQHLRNL